MSTLHLRLTANTQQLQLSRNLRPNRMTLVYYTVQLDADAHGQSAVDIALDWLRVGVYNSTQNNHKLTLPVAIGTRFTSGQPMIEVETFGSSIPVVSHCEIHDMAGALSTKVQEVNLYFIYSE